MPVLKSLSLCFRLGFRLGLPLAIGASLAGCAGTSTSSLQPAKSGMVVKFDKAYEFEDVLEPEGRKFHTRFSILPGNYPATFEDPAGTYYAGNGLCLRSELLSTAYPGHEGEIKAWRCGIFIPIDAAALPQIYYFRTSYTVFDKYNQARREYAAGLRPDMVEMNNAALRSPPPVQKNPTQNTDQVVLNTVVNSNLSPAQAGTTAAVGTAVGYGLMAIENKQFQFLAMPAANYGESLKKAIRIEKSDAP